jgi:RNA polymerase sigma-70 factor, ECF subfamily
MWSGDRDAVYQQRRGCHKRESSPFYLTRADVTTIAGSWMKAVDRPLASTTTTVDSQAETLRLFQEHGAALYRFCRSVLRHAGDAEDVVQETFLTLLDHLQRGGDARNLKSWLFTVAANACRDRTRWRLRWLPWNAERDERTVEPSAEARLKPDTTQIARKAFRALAPRDRLLLSLRAQGLSYKDIAVASGIREQSVGRLLARALDRWRKQCVA